MSSTREHKRRAPKASCLERLAALQNETQEAAKRLAALTAQRDNLIRECFQTSESGAPAIARVTGLTTAGVYKIRDRQALAKGGAD